MSISCTSPHLCFPSIQTFPFKFPSPPLKIHDLVKESCDRSVLDCIHLVSNYALANPLTINWGQRGMALEEKWKVDSEIDEAYYSKPWMSGQDQFEFRVRSVIIHIVT